MIDPERDPKRPRAPGDEAAPDDPQSAEDTCRRCGGSGRLEGAVCTDCAGRGTVTVLVGDA